MFTPESGKRKKKEMKRNAGKKSLNPPSELHPTHFPVLSTPLEEIWRFSHLHEGNGDRWARNPSHLDTENQERFRARIKAPSTPSGERHVTAGFDPSIADAE